MGSELQGSKKWTGRTSGGTGGGPAQGQRRGQCSGRLDLRNGGAGRGGGSGMFSYTYPDSSYAWAQSREARNQCMVHQGADSRRHGGEVARAHTWMAEVYISLKRNNDGYTCYIHLSLHQANYTLNYLVDK